MSKTDQELDDLEALLIERAENLNDPEAYHGDIAEAMLKAADALSELRVKNAVLRLDKEELEGLVIQYRDDLMHPPSEDSKERRIKAIHAVLHDKENTQ